MGRPRLPAHKREAAGAANNASRFSNLPDTPTSDAIGPPSEWLDGLQRETWAWAVREWWWLTEADRPLLEMICKYRALMIIDEMRGEDVSRYAALLSKVGGTPVDRGRVEIPGSSGQQDQVANRFIK